METGFITKTYTGGNKVIGYYKQGVPHGPFRALYPDGSIESTLEYKNGVMDGPFVYYFPKENNKSKIKIRGHYKDGKKTGLWITNRKNGSLYLENMYDCDELHGQTIEYLTTGNKRITNYERGKIISFKTTSSPFVQTTLFHKPIPKSEPVIPLLRKQLMDGGVSPAEYSSLSDVMECSITLSEITSTYFMCTHPTHPHFFDAQNYQEYAKKNSECIICPIDRQYFINPQRYHC